VGHSDCLSNEGLVATIAVQEGPRQQSINYVDGCFTGEAATGIKLDPQTLVQVIAKNNSYLGITAATRCNRANVKDITDSK
jgi:hypothetical protein